MMKKPILIFLAAGMGSRYGGLKQLDVVGPNGEVIMDYSIRDAIKAGFERIVMIIREDFEKEFKELISSKYAGQVVITHVYQTLTTATDGYSIPTIRSKPWGTGHALLAASPIIDAAFAVVNADDYYGAHSFEQAYRYLSHAISSMNQGMIGYKLTSTLSDHGHVNRGVCVLDDDGYLISVTEREQIQYNGEGQLVYASDRHFHNELSGDEIVSMNFWLFHPDIMQSFHEGFQQFLATKGHIPNAEYYIPSQIDQLIRDRKIKVKVLPTDSQWVGVTYPEDKENVMLYLSKSRQDPSATSHL